MGFCYARKKFYARRVRIEPAPGFVVLNCVIDVAFDL